MSIADFPALNPTQTAERIREMIVGRHLALLEQRVRRLETVEPPDATARNVDERVLFAEARIEAIQENIERLTDNLRDEFKRRSHLRREEVQRLAQQIQQVAGARPSPVAGTPSTEVHELERKVGAWLHQWKSGLQNHLESRDNRITAHIRGEIGSLKSTMERRIEDLERKSTVKQAVAVKLRKIAETARAFEESSPQLPPLPAIG